MIDFYKIPTLIPACDGRFDRYNWSKTINGWLYYIGGNLEDGYKICVFTAEMMASKGRRDPLCEIPIDNDEQFFDWVGKFRSLNGV